ncbi:sensor histidine kinase [Mycobacterium sp. LTG2003]
MSGEVAIALASALMLTAVAAVFVVRTRRVVATPTERAVHAALHTASLAARALRRGLDTESARTAAPFLRGLTVTDGLALFDGDGELLAQDPGDGPLWQSDVVDACATTARDCIAGQRRVLKSVRATAVSDWRLAAVVAQPLLTESGDVLGALVVVTAGTPGPGMLGAIGEVARYAASQIELAELDASRARLDRAEVLALRAQISPHFIYNALNTIASFVRTDPDRARELILEFADFTRYSFRAAGQYTTLAEELRNIDRYLTLERARFGAALKVRLQVAPEVLNVVVPFLALQPLVENAVRHGLAGQGGGSVEIVARDEGADCVITVEDDGAGMDPETLRAGHGDALADRTDESAHVGLTNVDHRLRAAFGNDYGLVVETAIGAGTKVVMRVPKFRSGVRASGGAFG